MTRQSIGLKLVLLIFPESLRMVFGMVRNILMKAGRESKLSMAESSRKIRDILDLRMLSMECYKMKRSSGEDGRKCHQTQMSSARTRMLSSRITMSSNKVPLVTVMSLRLQLLFQCFLS